MLLFADVPLDVSGSWEVLARHAGLARRDSFTPNPTFTKLGRHRMFSFINILLIIIYINTFQQLT